MFSPFSRWKLNVCLPLEIQNFMEAITIDQEPKSGILVASNTISILYATYVSAERKGEEVEIRGVKPSG